VPEKTSEELATPEAGREYKLRIDGLETLVLLLRLYHSSTTAPVDLCVFFSWHIQTQVKRKRLLKGEMDLLAKQKDEIERLLVDTESKLQLL
jgi:hypothetical protein